MPAPAQLTPPPDTGFDPLVFWVRHRRVIHWFLLLFVVALAIAGAAEYLRNRKLANAQALFAKAQTVEELRSVAAKYPDLVVAGNAELMIAHKLRADGKLDESNAALRSFLEHHTEHPLISGAWTSLASNLEAQGKTDEALAIHQKVTTSFSNSFSAPVALLAEARIFQGQGKKEEAKRVYDKVVASYGGTQFAAEALRASQRIAK